MCRLLYIRSSFQPAVNFQIIFKFSLIHISRPYNIYEFTVHKYTYVINILDLNTDGL